MRVIRTIESFYPRVSGPANQAFKISQELENRGISSPIVTTDFGVSNQKEREMMGKVEVHRFPCNNALMKYCYAPSAKEAFKNFDLVHAHNYRNYLAELGFNMAEKKKKPFVISTHGSLSGYKTIISSGLMKLPYSFYDLVKSKKTVLNADAVIVSSTQEMGEAIDFGVDKKKISIIPMGIDVSDYSGKKQRSDKLRLLFVGRISRDRNLELLIDAARVLKKKKINFCLNIVGGEVKRSESQRTGYIDELKRVVMKNGLKNHITFSGHLVGKELRNQYTNADVFVYTSPYENFGQTILEAGAARLGILTTNVGVAGDLIEDGLNGYLIEDNPNFVAQRVISLMDAKKRAAFSDKITQKIKRDFNWEGIIAKYLRVYRKLI